MKFVTHTEADNLRIAQDFIKNISPKSVAMIVGLYGNLGAGKTTFMKSVAKVFGVEDTITSPTFVIEKIYRIDNRGKSKENRFENLIHIDAYRIEKKEELLRLGWKEIISDPKNIIFIEWPERVEDIMPEHIKIRFSHGNVENEREIEMV